MKEFIIEQPDGLKVTIMRNDNLPPTQAAYYYKHKQILYVPGKLIYAFISSTCDTLEEYVDQSIAYAKEYLNSKI